jgi:hypothetical protein
VKNPGERAMTRSCFLILFFVLLQAVSSPALAQRQRPSFDYTYLEASYSKVDYDNFNSDGDGLGLKASFALSSHFHVFGGYAGQDIDSSIDANGWIAGVGINQSLSRLLDVVVRVSYQTSEVDAPGIGPVDNDGYGIGAGVRVGANEWIELFGGLNYVDLDSGNETTLDAGFLLNISRAFAIGVSGQWDDDVSILSLNGRLYFGSR